MGRKKRRVKRKEKRKKIHRPNKGPLWQVVDGKVVRTHRECPRCGAGVYMAKHYNRWSCGRCGHTKFETPAAERKSAAGIAGISPSRRRRKIRR